MFKFKKIKIFALRIWKITLNQDGDYLYLNKQISRFKSRKKNGEIISIYHLVEFKREAREYILKNEKHKERAEDRFQTQVGIIVMFYVGIFAADTLFLNDIYIIKYVLLVYGMIASLFSFIRISVLKQKIFVGYKGVIVAEEISGNNFSFAKYQSLCIRNNHGMTKVFPSVTDMSRLEMLFAFIGYIFVSCISLLIDFW